MGLNLEIASKEFVKERHANPSLSINHSALFHGLPGWIRLRSSTKQKQYNTKQNTRSLVLPDSLIFICASRLLVFYLSPVDHPTPHSTPEISFVQGKRGARASCSSSLFLSPNYNGSSVSVSINSLLVVAKQCKMHYPSSSALIREA